MSDLDDEWWIGYLWVSGAILCFGSFSLPIKYPPVRKANVDPVVFQCYYSLAVFITSWFVLFIQPFAWTPYGVAGASLWVPSSLLAISSINLVGIAIAQGVWSGSTIIVSFMWGAIAFDEQIDNWYLTILGLFLLLVGISGISLCNQQWNIALPPNIRILYRIIPCFKEQSLMDSVSTQDEDVDADVEKVDEVKSVSGRDSILGISAALLLGVTNGSMMVPTELTPDNLQGLAYVISFAIGVAIVTTIIAPVYFVLQYIRGKGFPQFHVRVACIPGLISGTIWNMGNICSIYATQYLGLTIGFPLTQMALLVGGLWGMILFREIRRLPAIFCFFSFAAILLTGALLLSLYG